MTAEDENSKRWNGSRPFKYLTSDHPVLAATKMIIGSAAMPADIGFCPA
jgi:hypothetical protein